MLAQDRDEHEPAAQEGSEHVQSLSWEAQLIF